jgi:hypothetical protein
MPVLRVIVMAGSLGGLGTEKASCPGGYKRLGECRSVGARLHEKQKLVAEHGLHGAGSLGGCSRTGKGIRGWGSQHDDRLANKRHKFAFYQPLMLLMGSILPFKFDRGMIDA